MSTYPGTVGGDMAPKKVVLGNDRIISVTFSKSDPRTAVKSDTIDITTVAVSGTKTFSKSDFSVKEGSTPAGFTYNNVKILSIASDKPGATTLTISVTNSDWKLSNTVLWYRDRPIGPIFVSSEIVSD